MRCTIHAVKPDYQRSFSDDEKIFWPDPYLSELKTRLKTEDGDQVTLHETIFYAFSDGQESDYRMISEIPVLEPGFRR
jgi:hypothetical protein